MGLVYIPTFTIKISQTGYYIEESSFTLRRSQKNRQQDGAIALMRQALRDAILAQGGQAAEGVFRFLFVCFCCVSK